MLGRAGDVAASWAHSQAWGRAQLRDPPPICCQSWACSTCWSQSWQEKGINIHISQRWGLSMQHRGAEWGSFTSYWEEVKSNQQVPPEPSRDNYSALARTETPHETQLFDPEIFFPPLKSLHRCRKERSKSLQMYLMLKSPDLKLSAFGHPTIYTMIWFHVLFMYFAQWRVFYTLIWGNFQWISPFKKTLPQWHLHKIWKVAKESKFRRRQISHAQVSFGMQHHPQNL